MLFTLHVNKCNLFGGLLTCRFVFIELIFFQIPPKNEEIKSHVFLLLFLVLLIISLVVSIQLERRGMSIYIYIEREYKYSCDKQNSDCFCNLHVSAHKHVEQR